MPEQTKRLGMVLKGYPRISETFISNEIRGLEKNGFAVHIFSMRKPRENFTHESVRDIQAKVTYLPESMLWGLPALVWNTLAYACSHPKRFTRGLRMLGSRFAGAPKKHTWLKHFMQGCYLANKAQGLDIAHLHAHFAHTPTTVALYGALFLDIPFSFTAHAKDIYTQAPERIREKLALARFAVTCTGYNKVFLDTLTERPERIHKVYHGIDLSLFNGAAALREQQPAEPPYRIMTVARFVEKKGLPDILHALAQLKKEGLDFRYALIGDGTDRKQLKQLVGKLGLDDVVEFTGTIAHDQVLEYFRTAQAFVLACMEAKDGDRDGIPNVIAESMAMGVPVVSTNVSGVPELVEDKVTGMLVPSRDVEAIAESIRSILTDAELRRRVIPAARDKVHEVFDNSVLIGRLGDIFADNDVPRSAN